MADTASPNPSKRWLLIVLWLVVMLVAASSLYTDVILGKAPRWLQFADRMNGAIIGSAIWVSADFYGSSSVLSSVWWRRFAIALFAVTAISLILFFR